MTTPLIFAVALLLSVGPTSPRNETSATVAQAEKPSVSLDTVVEVMNKSYKCTRDKDGAESCRLTYNGSVFEMKKVKPPFTSSVRLVALGNGHSVRIHRDCFEFNFVQRMGAVPVFITPTLELARFGPESNEKCGK